MSKFTRLSTLQFACTKSRRSRIFVLLSSVLLASFALHVGISTPPKAEDTKAPIERRHEEQVDPSYKIGAYYFGYWGPHFPLDQLRHYEQKFGKAADWWAGVRDLHDSNNDHEGLYKGEFRHLKPTIGYYDLSNSHVIEEHVRQASSYGLNYFNFYYFWDSQLQTEKYGDGLKSFLVAANRDKISFMLALVATASAPIPRSSFNVVADRLTSKYIVLSNYLRTPEGRPIVEILLTQGLGDGTAEDADSFVRQLRSAVRRRLSLDPFVLISSSVERFSKLNEADGYTCTDHYWYPEGRKTPVKSYESYIRHIDDYFNLISDAVGEGSFFYCVSSGHDERPRLYLNSQANSEQDVERIRELLPYYSERSPKLFETALRKVKARMDSGVSRWGNYLMIYAWNEWNEGGIIEPDEQNGAAYLSTIGRVFSSPRPQPKRP